MKLSSKVSYLVNREKGQIPVSIATSLALEGLLNIHPDTKHKDIPLQRFQTLWINVRTLYRNMYTSMERQAAEALTIEDLAYGMVDDIENISQWSNMVEVSTPVIYYHSEYKDLDKLHPHARFRQSKTPIQLRFQQRQNQTIKMLFDQKTFQKFDGEKGNILLFDNKIRPKYNPNVGMLTHIPYDLTNDNEFSKLILVESHTGNVKSKTQWYTKYHNHKDLPPLPFSVELLQMLGDKEMFKPMPKGLRTLIKSLAEKYKWTPLTTKDRIIQGFSLAKEIEYGELVKEIYKIKK